MLQPRVITFFIASFYWDLPLFPALNFPPLRVRHTQCRHHRAVSEHKEPANQDQALRTISQERKPASGLILDPNEKRDYFNERKPGGLTHRADTESIDSLL
jgi:hypothetical protein